MLSFEKAPDPTTPCPPLLKSDDASHKLTFQNQHHNNNDLDLPLPSFSIRDYVFNVRNKHIEKTWPFSQQHLQLCSQYEIKDLLPPFEPPEAVRKQCLQKGSQHELVSHFHTKEATTEFVSLEKERSPSLEQQEKLTHKPGSFKLSGSGHVEAPIVNDLQSENEYPICNGKPSCSLQEDNSASESNVALHNTQLLFASQKNDSSAAPSGKKCRLILKLSSSSVPTHTEEITLNTAAMSDSMASKVCPVCKTFSSSSNTTLNAHIDQCLVVESTSKWIPNDVELTKHIMKPTKKRSMVDIYATAPRCTLEELDRRNGSNWAADSSLLTAEAKTNVDEKMRRLSVAALDDSDNENSVYFDSNGTKIRIISKFSITSMPAVGYEPRKLTENGEESKIVSHDVKTHFHPKNVRRHKTKPRCMKLCSITSNKFGISKVQERNHRMGKGCGKEEYLSQTMRARDGIKCGQPGKLRKLVCSKRTRPLTMVDGKYDCHGLRFSSSMLTIETNKMSFPNSSLEGSTMLSSPLESVVSSSDSIHADSSFYETQENAYGQDLNKCNQLTKIRTASRRGRSFQLPESSGACASSLRSKGVEIDASPAETSDGYAKDNESILSNELVDNLTFSSLKFELNGKLPTLKKPRTRRTLAEMGNQVKAQPGVEEQYDCLRDSAVNLTGRSQRGVSHNSDRSSDEARLEVEEIIDQFSVIGAGALTSRREGEATKISEPGKVNTTVDASHPRVHCQDLDVFATFESHVKSPIQKLYSSKKFTDNLECQATGDGDVPLNIDTHSFSRKVGVPILKTSKTCPSEISNLPNLSDCGEYEGCVRRTEVVTPSVQQKWSDCQVTHKANDVHRILQRTGRLLDDNSQLVGTSSSEVRCPRYGTDPQSVPAPLKLPLPSICNLNSEDLQEKLSLTSNKMPFPQDSHMVVHRDPSESPVSANSHPTIVRSKSKFLEPESCAKPSAVQDRLDSGFSGGSSQPIVGNAVSSLFKTREERVERISLDGESFTETNISPTEDPVNFRDDEACCCLWKRSLYSDAASIDQEHTRESSVVSAKRKQMAHHKNVRPEIFVNSTSFPTSRINDMVAPTCESPRGSISHSSADVVHRQSHDETRREPTFSQVQDTYSTSNPVLRLMGKNLMVVNKDEDACVKLRQTPPGSTNAYMNHFRFSPSSMSDQDCVSSQFTVSGDSVILSQGSCDQQPQFFDNDYSKRFRSQSCSKSQQRRPMIVNQNITKVGQFDSSMTWHGLESTSNVQIQQKQHINKLDMFPSFITPADFQHHNPPPVQMAANHIQEIIVIDDSPESADESLKHRGGSQQSPMAVFPSRPTLHHSSPVGVIHSHRNIQQRGAFPFHTSSNSVSAGGRNQTQFLPSAVPWESKFC